MATNALISPGVLARENDTSFVNQRPITVGAAIIGPTVKGPVEIPTIVTSYSEYINKFGDMLVSGSDNFSYLTSISAYNYFANGGETLLVSRVVSGAYSPAESTNINNLIASVAGNYATATFTFSSVLETGSNTAIAFTVPGNDNIYYFAGSQWQYGDPNFDYYYFSPTGNTTWTLNQWGTALATAINTANLGIENYISASWNTNTLTISGSNFGTAYNGVNLYTRGYVGWDTANFTGPVATTAGGTDGVSAVAFVLETISEGTIMNSNSTQDSRGALPSGSINNVRWQIINPNTSSGTFGLLIRQGNDTTNNPIVLETWTNLSLDPMASNYVSRVLGDYTQTYNPTTNQIEITGDYPNASRYVRVKSVNYPTPNYLLSSGLISNPAYTDYIPLAATGAFDGATGTIANNVNLYNTISNTNTQGLIASNYDNMINLLSNKDDYKFNALYTPGLISEFGSHTSKVNTIIANTQDRGDNIYIVDLVGYGSSVTSVTGQADSLDTSYAAAYWPWCQIKDPATGKNVWVPASAMIAGVYAYNDKVAEPWFAPAGINRGGLGRVIRAEYKLNQSQRDELYLNKVNPIATFPGTGVVVYGQKTLQSVASALDRVNVRRLLIQLKSYISQVANNLVFEQNTAATRNQFLSQVNPYLETVQQKQGLYAFKVIMDSTNNTPDVIDRNELVGQIYLQPTKTAEFIYLDFNITPTGATFPA
jgi:hypothetical protein